MNCAQCRFWVRTPALVESPGECRRRPPAPAFPLTEGDDWCGDFEAPRLYNHPARDTQGNFMDKD